MSHVCPWWLIYTFDNAFRRLVYNAERMFTPYVEPGMTVLDMGCGRGFNSLGLARIVGREGRVIAADLQEGMLQRVRERIQDSELEARVQLHQCAATAIGVTGPVDFALAFYVVHEVPDQGALFRELAHLLAPAGRLLVVEPPVHVSRARFKAMVQTARDAGLVADGGPRVVLSKSVVLRPA